VAPGREVLSHRTVTVLSQEGKRQRTPVFNRLSILDADLVRTIHGFDALRVLTGSTASANL
jgi:hypothetical protein